MDSDSTLFTAKPRLSNTYTADDIEVLEGLEPVRKRPGMYIGGTDSAALHHLACEILDNSMDEVTAGFAKKIEVVFDESTGTLSVTDDGRGIPFDPHPKYPGQSALEVILGTLHSGGKFKTNVYQTSGGLHGVGLSVVNALSDHFEVEVYRDGQRAFQRYSRGKPESPLVIEEVKSRRHGTTIRFHPDPEIFEEGRFQAKILLDRVKSKAYLIQNVLISWVFKPKDPKQPSEIPTSCTFSYPQGLASFLEQSLTSERSATGLASAGQKAGEGPDAGTSPLSETNHESLEASPAENGGGGQGASTEAAQEPDFLIFHGSAPYSDQSGRIEWAVAWELEVETIWPLESASFCNTIPTPLGGTHEAGFKQGLLKAIRAFGEMVGNKKAEQISAEDIEKSTVRLVSCFVEQPQFQGQTKEKLTTTSVQKLTEATVKDYTTHWLTSQPQRSTKLLEVLIEEAEQRLRNRQKAKEGSRLRQIHRLRLPGKLADALSQKAEENELFLVEGDSAGGSAKQARDRKTQAVLPLRGKILNVATASAEKLHQNQEISDLAVALGCGTRSSCKPEKLRYHKIIIMTDADVDGAHIATLLLAFFFKEMYPVLSGGFVYLACPPLYRLSTAQQTVYARDDAEKDRHLRATFKKSQKVEISRFKGLGEMRVDQLRTTTMAADSRQLIRVLPEDFESCDEFLDRIMGRRAECRFQLIQEKAPFFQEIDV